MKWVSILLLLCGLMAAPGRVTVAVESGAGERYVVAWSFELGSQERSAGGIMSGGRGSGRRTCRRC